MQTDNLLSFKIVFVGESKVGKTCIFNRYNNNSFSDVNPTVGANFCSKNIFNENVKQDIEMELWDTPGRFRQLGNIFYKNANVIGLVYDTSNKESFIQLKKFWIEDIKSNISNCNRIFCFFVIGNKIDMLEEEQVTDQEAQEFSAEINGIYKPISAKLGSGIDDLLMLMQQKLVSLTFADF